MSVRVISPNNEAVRSWIEVTEALGTSLVYKRLNKGVPFFLMFCWVMLESCKDRFVASLGLTVDLRMLRNSGEIFYTKQVAQGREELVTNWTQLLVRIYVNVPYCIRKWSKERILAVGDLVLHAEIA